MRSIVKPIALSIGILILLVAITGARFSRGYWGASEMHAGNLTVDGTAAVTGAATLDGATALNEATTFAKELNLTGSAVSLTSPTVTMSAANRNLIVLNSDANQTGHVVTGGTLNQVLLIRMGAGSNTARFDDDGTSMALGGNLTLTEGQGDVLGLLCTSADGDEWSCILDRSGN